MPEPDVFTQNESHVIAVDYAISPKTGLKCERNVVPETEIRSMFLCDTAHETKCFVQYNYTGLEE